MGIGRALMEFAERQVGDGKKHISVKTSEGRGFLEHLGYRMVGDAEKLSLPVPNGERTDVLVYTMAKGSEPTNNRYDGLDIIEMCPEHTQRANEIITENIEQKVIEKEYTLTQAEALKALQTPDALLGLLSRSDSKMYVALLGGEVVGTVGVWTDYVGQKQIMRLYVDLARQSKRVL